MKPTTRVIDEWIAEGLAYDVDLGFADKELIPSEAVTFTREFIRNLEGKEAKPLESFQSEREMGIYIDSVLCQNELYVYGIKEIVDSRYYFGVFRDNMCLISEQSDWFNEYQYVEIREQSSIERFMTHVFHSDWEIDFENAWKENCTWEMVKQVEDWDGKCRGIPFLFPISKLKNLPIDVKMTEVVEPPF